MSIVHRQPDGTGAMGGLLQAGWRYKWLITAAVLVGALLGYGWAARQPTLYAGVSRVIMTDPCPPLAQCVLPPSPAQLLHSPAVLERVVKLSGNRISAEALGQRLQVDVAQHTDLVTIRVVDSTAKGAAQLADSVPLAYDQVVVQPRARKMAEQLRSMEARCGLENTLANDVVEPAGRSNDDRLRDKCAVNLALLRLLQQYGPTVNLLQRAAVPEQPIQPRPGRPMAIGMLLELLASVVLVWWRTRRQGPPASAPAQGPELSSPA
jgi:capsular polysaccharide biosynthesis protein